LVDYSERRRYVELASKLLGFLVEKVELGGWDDAPPVNFDLNVRFVDSADLEQLSFDSVCPLSLVVRSFLLDAVSPAPAMLNSAHK